MNKIIKTNNILTENELIEQVREDVATYLWASESWASPPDGYNTSYLLILALSHRARSRFALRLTDQDMLPGYQAHKKDIDSLRSRADEILSRQFQKHRKQIESLVSDEFPTYLDELEATLDDVRHIAQDGYLLDDPEWVEDDLRETAHDFFLEFNDLALTNEELNQDPFRSAIDAEAFHARFAEIEKKFKRYFGHFHIISDLFPIIQAREYAPDCWWLNRLPDPNEIKDTALPDELMESFCETWQAAGAAKPLDCPESDNAIAYALHELPPEQNRQFREHLLSCRFCLDLVLDTRWADAESKAHEGAILPVPEVLRAAIYGTPPGPSEKDEQQTQLKQIFVAAYAKAFVIAIATKHLQGIRKPEAKRQDAYAQAPPEWNVLFVPTPEFPDDGVENFECLDPGKSAICQIVGSNKKFVAFFLDQEGKLVQEPGDMDDIEEDDPVELEVPPQTQAVFIAVGPEDELEKAKKTFASDTNRPFDNTSGKICWIIYGPKDS